MALITRPYTYTAGTVIDPAQVTSNETTLYNDYNGNIDADNIASLAENVIVFAASGHAHSGGAGGAPVQLVQGTNIASAASLTIPTDGNVCLVTGSTGVTALSTRNSGVTIFLRFQSGLTLTHNGTSLILQDARDLVVQANDVLAFYSLGSGNWLQLTRKPWRTERGTIQGLTLSNNGTDPTNDIDIAAGWTRSGDDLDDLVLAAALTKQLDAAWAVGSGAGGLDTGAIANDTYHVWLIKRIDTGVVDALFSLSASAPTMPTNYTEKRLIGSIIRSGGAIVLFDQDGDRFLRDVPAGDRAQANPGTAAATVTLSVPTGRVLDALITFGIRNATTAGIQGLATALVQADTAPSATVHDWYTGEANDNQSVVKAVRTNTSAQIRTRQSASGVSDTQLVITHGWIDRRGQDDAA